MKYNNIAVIGMSGRFASAGNRKEFRELLKNKKSAIQNPPEERLDLMKLPNGQYAKAGYLTGIAEFDNEFFNIPKREAKLMSPEQRISLELVADAILDAGYSLKEFRGANCGVFAVGADSIYERYAGRQTSASILGSQSFMNSGRIGYQFDLRGENVVVNSGCSSALMALHYACEKISYGELDTAIVGGVKLYIDLLKEKDNIYDNVGIISKNYELHTFDEQANGTVCGEGGGYVVLKSLEEAKKDGDHIYGVLVSGGVSGDGQRGSSVSIPSQEAQTEAILKAWNGMELENLTEIEAHGIGSQIGDVTEVQAIVEAVKRSGTLEHQIRVSALKPNIGYLLEVSGIASLLKVLTGYQYQETYPVANLKKVNPQIPFADGGLVPAKEVYHWEEEKERMTGISSFTLNGNNVHVVVKNYCNGNANKELPFMLKLSAKSEKAFDRMRKEILSYLSEGDLAFGDAIYTLNKGRDDYEFRRLIGFDSLVDLKNKLEELEPRKINDAEYEVVYVMSAQEQAAWSYDKYSAILPGFSNRKMTSTGEEEFDFKVSMYHYLVDLGLKNGNVLADEVCQAAIHVSDGTCTKEEFEQIKMQADRKAGYGEYTEQIVRMCVKDTKKKFLVIDFSVEHELDVLSEHENIKVFYINDCKEVQELLGLWYEVGQEFNWETYYYGCDYHRVSAPTYSFDKSSFWVEIESKEEETEAKEKTVSVKSTRLAEKKVFFMKSEVIDSVNVFQYPYSNQEFHEVFVPETGDIDVDYKLAMYRYLISQGVLPDIIMGDRKALAIVDYAKGRLSKKRLLQKLKNVEDSGYAKGYVEVEKLAKENYVRIFDFTHDDYLSNHQWKGNVQVLNLLQEQSKGHFFDSQQQIMSKAVKEGLENVLEASELKASNPEPESEGKQKMTNGQKTPQIIEAEKFLEETWANAFNLDGAIGHDEDFFSLGGNSLIMAAMSDVINEHFGIKFDIFEIFDYETIEKLAVKIVEEL